MTKHRWTRLFALADGRRPGAAVGGRGGPGRADPRIHRRARRSSSASAPTVTSSGSDFSLGRRRPRRRGRARGRDDRCRRRAHAQERACGARRDPADELTRTVPVPARLRPPIRGPFALPVPVPDAALETGSTAGSSSPEPRTSQVAGLFNTSAACKPPELRGFLMPESVVAKQDSSGSIGSSAQRSGAAGLAARNSVASLNARRASRGLARLPCDAPARMR